MSDMHITIERRLRHMPIPASALDERTRLLLRVELEAVTCEHTAMLFGTPITRERARAQIVERLSDAERALLAKPAEAVQL